MTTRTGEVKEELSWSVHSSLSKPTMYSDLVEFWKSQNIEINPANEVDITAFEDEYGVHLPWDFRQYLLETSGTGPYGDRENFEFYPLARLKLWSETPWNNRSYNAPPNAPSTFHTEDFLIFGDYLAICYAYAIRVRGDAADIGEIMHWGMKTYSPICRTFRAFIDLYLADDRRLHIVRTIS